MSKRGLLAVFVVLLCFGNQTVRGEQEDFAGAIATEKVQILCTPRRGGPIQAPLPKKSKLVSLEELSFVGPKPSHPFVLGTFDVDGRWGIERGLIARVAGTNAALQIGWADEFELEGVMEMTGLGGWFLLIGWNEGGGYGIHNVVMKDSGSPWFVSQFRGNRAIEDGTVELEKFLWNGEQPFRLTVQSEKLNLQVGRHRVVNEFPVEGYGPGRIILGTYETRYGPRTVRIGTLKLRALSIDNVAPEEK